MEKIEFRVFFIIQYFILALLFVCLNQLKVVAHGLTSDLMPSLLVTLTLVLSSVHL